MFNEQFVIILRTT